MTAIRKRNALAALLMVLCLLLSFSIVSVSADDTDVEGEATAAEAEATGAATDAATDAATEAATEAGTTGTTEKVEKVDHTQGIINLCVGGVILIALIALAIVFRKKIPVWYRSLKSECGKIVWCPKDKLKKNTFVVIVIILALTVLIGVLDFAFSNGLILLNGLFKK